MPNGNPVTADKRVELLHDHYKDTFQHLYDHWKVRNRLFALILIVLALMLFQLTSPNVLEQLVNSYIREQTKYTVPGGEVNLVDFRFITSLLWFALASLLVQYYQRSVLVDRLYVYLDLTEGRISDLLGAGFITREGAFYKAGLPKVLKHVHFLYRGVFFALLLAVVVAKAAQEWVSVKGAGWAAAAFSVADTVIALAILYYSWLYLNWAYPKERTE